MLFGERDRFVAHSDRLLEEPFQRDRDVLRLASVVLANESFEMLAPTGGTAPRAWFLNLEVLFEKAIRTSLRRVSPTGVTVGKPRGQERSPVFPERGLVPATPDLLLSKDGDHLAVGDVKYKDLEAQPDPSDLYQLLVHASAYGVRRAFLVFPGDSYRLRSLGLSSTGCQVWVLELGVDEVQKGLKKGLVEMGLTG